MQNRLSKFWLKPPEETTLAEAFEAADGEGINRLTGGMITALASSEGTEFWFQSDPVHRCPPGRDARKHLARELRGLALRCTQAARSLEGGEDA
jgi:hypothetical protein